MNSNPVVHGGVNVGPQPVPLGKHSRTNGASVIIQADRSNSVPIYLGGVSVTPEFSPLRAGLELAPGETLHLQLASLDGLHLVAAKPDQRVRFVAGQLPTSNATVR